MINKIKQISSEKYPEVLEIFKEFHAYPELSGEEQATSDRICRILETLEIPYKHGFAGHGIVAKLSNPNADNKRIIGIRADMDALPIEEENGLPYCSKHPGIMHACGHDFHMASLLGTAMVLNEFRQELQGTVLLIFQPSEEQIPGGAKQMIEEGALGDIKPDVILAQHVMPELKTGSIGLRSGMMMASSDQVQIRIKGKGGHGALPFQVIDPILIAAHLIISLQQVISRRAKPTVPTVLSFGKIEGGSAHNIIPDSVELLGTFRTYDEVWRKEAHDIIQHMSQTLCRSMGARCQVIIDKGYPAVINAHETALAVQKTAETFLGKSQVIQLDPDMGSEDFSYFAEQSPAVLYRLGVGPLDSPAVPLHNSRFIGDPEALKTGTALMSYLALSLLEQ